KRWSAVMPKKSPGASSMSQPYTRRIISRPRARRSSIGVLRKAQTRTEPFEGEARERCVHPQLAGQFQGERQVLLAEVPGVAQDVVQVVVRLQRRGRRPQHDRARAAGDRV